MEPHNREFPIDIGSTSNVLLTYIGVHAFFEINPNVVHKQLHKNKQIISDPTQYTVKVWQGSIIDKCYQ